jgi:hypothetical protein
MTAILVSCPATVGALLSASINANTIEQQVGGDDGRCSVHFMGPPFRSECVVNRDEVVVIRIVVVTGPNPPRRGCPISVRVLSSSRARGGLDFIVHVDYLFVSLGLRVPYYCFKAKINIVDRRFQFGFGLLEVLPFMGP